MHNAKYTVRFVVCLLGCDTIWSGWFMQTFQRHLGLLPPLLQQITLLNNFIYILFTKF